MQYAETPAPTLRRATASFLAEEEDELSFEAGDTIELLGESGSPGWLLGRRGQLVGLVPPGYFPEPPQARPPAFGPGSASCSSDHLGSHHAAAAAAAVDADVLAAFMRFDRNGSGKLDDRELDSALATLQLDATTAEARCLLSNPMRQCANAPMRQCPMPNNDSPLLTSRRRRCRRARRLHALRPQRLRQAGLPRAGQRARHAAARRHHRTGPLPPLQPIAQGLRMPNAQCPMPN